MNDQFNLQRFVDAQQPVFNAVCTELREGCKRSHWMWFIFPQIQGLGASAMARRFAISSIQEARAYLKHPLLGPRLRECSQLVAQVQGRSIAEIFASPDDMKFRSSMTLFARAAVDNQIFNCCLQKYYDAQPDPMTLAVLENDL